MMFLIWSIERKMWWGIDQQGYTLHLDEAGAYGSEDTAKIVRAMNHADVIVVAIPVPCVMGG